MNRQQQGIFDKDGTEYLCIERNKVQGYKADIEYTLAGSFSSEYSKGYWRGQQAVLDRLFGDKCLPDTAIPSNSTELNSDKELHEDNFAKFEPSVQVDSRFFIGQQVKIVKCTLPEFINKVGTVTSIDGRGRIEVEVDGLGSLTHLPCTLEPYTESESRNLSQEIANCDKPEDNQLKDNMEEKELNLIEIIKDCPLDTPLFSLSLGDVTLYEIRPENADRSIRICKKDAVGNEKAYARNANGKLHKDGFVDLLPSRALYEKYPLDAKKAWDEWAEERKPKVKLHVSYEIIQGCLHGCGDFPTLEFYTDKEAQQAAEAVRETLLKIQELNTKK